MNSDRYPRRLLLRVTGLPPQIVTESCYALILGLAPFFSLKFTCSLLPLRCGEDRI